MKRILVLGLMLAIATMTNVAFAQNVDNVRAQSARATQAVTDAEAAVNAAKENVKGAETALTTAKATVTSLEEAQKSAENRAKTAAQALETARSKHATSEQTALTAEAAATTAKKTALDAKATWKKSILDEAVAHAAQTSSPSTANEQAAKDATAKEVASEAAFKVASEEEERLEGEATSARKTCNADFAALATAETQSQEATAAATTAKQDVETASAEVASAETTLEAKRLAAQSAETELETAKRLAASLGLLLQNTDEITATQSDVSNMKTEVRGKAQADSVTALARQLNELAETVAANARQTNERFKGKADKSDLQATNNEVAELRGTVGRQGTLLEAHEAELQRHRRRLNTIEEEMKSFLRIPLSQHDADYLAEKLGVLDLKKELATHSVNAAKRFSDIETNLSNLKMEVASMPVPKRDAYVTKLVKTVKPNCYGQPVECWVYETVPLASLFQAKN